MKIKEIKKIYEALEDSNEKEKWKNSEFNHS